MSEKKYPTIYSIDFDGTIVEKGKFPEFGRPVEKVVDYIREIQKRGDDWILNTNREGKDLEMAVTWLKENVLPSITKHWSTTFIRAETKICEGSVFAGAPNVKGITNFSGNASTRATIFIAPSMESSFS